MYRGLSLFAVATVLALAGCAAPSDGSADAQRCQRLRALYEGRSVRLDGYTQPGKLDRDIGVDLCRRGRFAEGAAALGRAVDATGLNLDGR